MLPTIPRRKSVLSAVCAGAIASPVYTGNFFSFAFAGTEDTWTTLAMGDCVEKLCMDLYMLAPFRMALWRPQVDGFAI